FWASEFVTGTLKKKEKLWWGRNTRKPENQGLSGFLMNFKNLKADRTELERARFYALDTVSCEGGAFGATVLRPGKRAEVKVPICRLFCGFIS
ncbi:MAG: hypothetical protein P4L51_18365, partial [Puia sp.]|nr:hypothetical protein [Puia sp.]